MQVDSVERSEAHRAASVGLATPHSTFLHVDPERPQGLVTRRIPEVIPPGVAGIDPRQGVHSCHKIPGRGEFDLFIETDRRRRRLERSPRRSL